MMRSSTRITSEAERCWHSDDRQGCDLGGKDEDGAEQLHQTINLN